MHRQALPNMQGVEFISLTKLLTDFRRKLESEADAPIEHIKCNAATLLHDLVVHLELGQQQHDTILGDSAVQYLTDLLSERIVPTPRH